MATWGVKIGTYDIAGTAPISGVKIVNSRRLQQFPIIRNEVTLIPEGKPTPIQINITGTIAGGNYSAMRDELSALRGAVESTTQNFYLDDDRYVRVVSKSLDYSFVTTDFCNYNARFLGELPYWLAATAESNVNATPTSGVTYPINNGGDVPIALKIVIDANEVGTIADNIQFENATDGSLLKFRGTLTETQQLVIDMGYDNHNVIKYKVELDGVNAMSAFEGDFMRALAGTNYLELTGSVACTVTVHWREGFYS